MRCEELIITKFNNIFTANNQKGKLFELKNRYCACFIVPLDGSIKFTYEGGSIVADGSHPIFIPEGLSYTNECLEDAQSLVFSFHTLGQYQAPTVLSRVSHTFARETYEAIEKALISGARERSSVVLRELYSLAASLFAAAEELSPGDEVIRKATELMHARYGDPTLTVAAVARQCFVSEIYLRKLFGRRLNVTPFRFLTDIRMTRARSLARERIPVKEIAAAVGFSDIYQFSRAYKRYYGYPPTETV